MYYRAIPAIIHNVNGRGKFHVTVESFWPPTVPQGWLAAEHTIDWRPSRHSLCCQGCLLELCSIVINLHALHALPASFGVVRWEFVPGWCRPAHPIQFDEKAQLPGFVPPIWSKWVRIVITKIPPSTMSSVPGAYPTRHRGQFFNKRSTARIDSESTHIAV